MIESELELNEQFKRENYIHERVFDQAEEEDLQKLMQKFISEKAALLERKRAKGMESVVSGTLQYLAILRGEVALNEDGEPEASGNEFVDKLESHVKELHETF